MADIEPKRSLKEVEDILNAKGELLELEEKTIFGRKLRVWKNLPPTFSLYWQYCVNEYKDREYVVLDDERVTYMEMHKRALAIASLLSSKHGIKKGSKVAIVSKNTPTWGATWWAIHLLGAVAVAVNCWLTTDAMVHCLELAEVEAAVLDEERAKQLSPVVQRIKKNGCGGLFVASKQDVAGIPSLQQALARNGTKIDIPKVEILPEDDACIFFTSGTTSFPKAVLSTQRMSMSNLFSTGIAGRREILRRGEDVPPLNPNDPPRIGLLVVPLFHVTGCLSFFVPAAFTGGKVILMNKWSVKEGLRIIQKEGVTATGGVPFIAQELLEHGTPEQLKTLASLSYGGAPAQANLPNMSRKLPNNLMGQAYGLSETNAGCVSHAGYDYMKRPESTGLPSPANDCKIIDNNGKELKAGEIGEICIRGPNVFKEYYRDPKATAAALDKDGWFKSGDLGYIDEEGFVYIKDRAKDIIIRGGENIAATQVENALFRDDRIQDCAVVGVPDQRLGEVVAAVVVLKASASKTTEKEVIDHVKKYLPKHEVPVMVMLSSPKDASEEVRIERNANGKVVKKTLKEIVAKEHARRNSPKAKL